MATYKVNNSDGRGEWEALTVYGLTEVVCCLETLNSGARQTVVYECTTGGTSGAAEPTWNSTPGQTTNDGTVVWTTRDPTSWALSHPSLFGLMASTTRMNDGDIVKVHDAHNEQRLRLHRICMVLMLLEECVLSCASIKTTPMPYRPAQ